MESTKPLSEKSYTVRQSLPGDLIKKSKKRPDWHRQRHEYKDEHMLPRVVTPIKQYDPIVSSIEGMITPMTFQGEIQKKFSESHVKKSTKPLSEKSYKVRQSLPGEVIKKSERELMKFTTPEPKGEV